MGMDFKLIFKFMFTTNSLSKGFHQFCFITSFCNMYMGLEFFFFAGITLYNVSDVGQNRKSFYRRPDPDPLISHTLCNSHIYIIILNSKANTASSAVCLVKRFIGNEERPDPGDETGEKAVTMITSQYHNSALLFTN